MLLQYELIFNRGIESRLTDRRLDFSGEIVYSADENTLSFDNLPDLGILSNDLLLLTNLPRICVIHYLLLHGCGFLSYIFEVAHDHFIY